MSAARASAPSATYIVSGDALEPAVAYSVSRYLAYADGRIERKGRAIVLEGATVGKCTPARNEVLIANRQDGTPGRYQLWGEWACGLFASHARLR